MSEEHDTMKIWNKVRTPPPEALKKIGGGRLKGMTDISPMWRYEVMTEVFGPCGEGWKYTIEDIWTEDGTVGQVFMFARIMLHISGDDKPDGCPWSDGIPGVGGSMLITKESAGLHCNDEAVKMAVTDALSVAMKQIGVGADIYSGKTDGSKYNKPDKKDKIVISDTYKVVEPEIKKVTDTFPGSKVVDVDVMEKELLAADTLDKLKTVWKNQAKERKVLEETKLSYITAVKDQQKIDIEKGG